MRHGKWKGLRYGTADPLQLYDVSTDPAEKADLAARNPKVVKQIEAVMAKEHTHSEFYPAVEKPKARRGKK